MRAVPGPAWTPMECAHFPSPRRSRSAPGYYDRNNAQSSLQRQRSDYRRAGRDQDRPRTGKPGGPQDKVIHADVQQILVDLPRVQIARRELALAQQHEAFDALRDREVDERLRVRHHVVYRRRHDVDAVDVGVDLPGIRERRRILPLERGCPVWLRALAGARCDNERTVGCVQELGDGLSR